MVSNWKRNAVGNRHKTPEMRAVTGQKKLVAQTPKTQESKRKTES